MKDRITQFLAAEMISPAEFADKIGVQRSSMSHILNGRNYPSASFLQKMLQAYPAMNPRWLMIGDGAMNMDVNPSASHTSAVPDFKSPEPATGFQTEVQSETDRIPHTENVKGNNPPVAGISMETDNLTIQSNIVSQSNEPRANGKEIEQVLFFFKDKTFSIYLPS